MSIRPPTTAAPANLLEDRPPTAPQSPMPRRRRELTPEGLDSMAAMERALEEAVKQDHRAEKATAPAYEYDSDPQYRFGKLNLNSPPATPAPAPPPPPPPATKSFVMEMPPVRGFASLQEAMSFPDKLSQRYGRGDMSSCTVVAYVEGVMDFISPSAAVDFHVSSEADWQVIRDRVIDLLEQGKNAAYILCNEDRTRKGLPAFPDPKPDYTNDYAKSVMSKLEEKWMAETEEKIAPKETTATDDVALDAAARAEQLMKEKSEFDKSEQEKWDKLPLFHPGKTYTSEQAANGYRVMDGYAVSYNQNDDVHVSAERTGPYEAGKTMTVINRWSDGGLAWMYWTNKAPQGSNGMLLRECVVRHGMGGWVDKKNDRRAKVVFLDAGRSIQPGRCFIVAMDIPSTGNRMLVKGNELNEDVFRVFRSAVPEDIQKVITLRELINARQLAEAKSDASMRMPGWWHM